MNKIIVFLLLFFTGFSLAFSQNHPKGDIEKRIKEVREYKMKYLAQEMELSETQKIKFFEVYEEMSMAKRSCFKEARDMERKLKKGKDSTEDDYRKATEAMNTANAEWAEKEKVFNDKFAEFLTPKQIFKMKEAEESFNAKLKEMKINRKLDKKKPHDGK